MSDYDPRRDAFLSYEAAIKAKRERGDTYSWHDRPARVAEQNAGPKQKGTDIMSRTYEPFQVRVRAWMRACFGAEVSYDRKERNHRFVEEALELAQVNGCTACEAHQLVDYVFGRPVGQLHQEVGGVMVTLAALCEAAEADMMEDGEAELARIWAKISQIRAKHAAKPKHSPLPGAL